MNRIFPEQLNQHLSQRLAKVYFGRARSIVTE